MLNPGKTTVIFSKLSLFAGAAVAALAAVAAPGFGAISTITSITTSMSSGTPTTVNGLPGVGAVYSQFQKPSTYNVTYGGNDLKLNTVTAGGTTYTANGIASAVVERGSNGTNTDNIWLTGTNSGSTISLQGPKQTSLVGAFGGNNLLIGADNLFSNTGNSVGNNTNIARLDMIFSSGLKASASAAFSVFDRGPTNDHDAFKIAAITALDSSGNPSNYGPLLSLANGSWGSTDLISTQEEVILRKNNSGGANFNPSDSTAQPIGGVLLQTNSLVAAGTTIYGYSLFSGVTTGSGMQLVDFTNKTYFPAADSTSLQGGLDPVGTSAVLFTTAVPEPTTAAVIAIAAAGLLGSRGNRKAKAV